MGDHKENRLIISMDKNGEQTVTKAPVSGFGKIVIVINNQIADSPNTTQIASGAGHNSAAGNNAALDSSNTLQQQSVGGAGAASNDGMEGKQTEPHEKHTIEDDDTLVIVINNQISMSECSGLNNQALELETQSAATQVASGGGFDSAGGTNAAIGSSNTKQQFAVAGSTGSTAANNGMNAEQQETA